MIDLQYAKDNINKYKYDYLGYLVIVDGIRTLEVINNDSIKEKQKFLKYLTKKYSKEIKIIAKYIGKNGSIGYINKLNEQQLLDKLNFMYDILPAIGFIILGLEKKIGIENTILIH